MKWLSNQWKKSKFDCIVLPLAVIALVYLLFFDAQSPIQIGISGKVHIESR